jgi:hypothetical protein
MDGATQLKDDLNGLSSALRELQSEVAELVRLRSTARNATTSSISVNAGGAATWITAWASTMACAVMLGMSLVGAFWGFTEFQKAAAERAELRDNDNDMRDYISVIYQIAPELQKRYEQVKKDREQAPDKP